MILKLRLYREFAPKLMINNEFFSEKRVKSGFYGNFSEIVLLINSLRRFSVNIR